MLVNRSIPIPVGNIGKQKKDMFEKHLKKIKRKGRIFLRNSALEMGLYGHPNYTKFIILGAPRTGSNLIRSSLNNHSGIITFGELFREFDDDIAWGFANYPRSRRIKKMRQSNPTKFLEKKVFKNYPKRISAVGFKIFYIHAQEEQWKSVWNYLINQADLNVIHLKRRNHLKVVLSVVKALKTDNWIQKTNIVQESAPIHIDYAYCLDVLTKLQKWESKYDSLFAENKKIEIIYEQLCSNYDQEMKRIQEFLEVKYEIIKPSTYKQSIAPISKSIENFWELKEQFKNTPWERYFEDTDSI